MGPVQSATATPPDAALETELASFAALRPTDPTESTAPDSAHLDEADPDPEETR